MLSVPLPGLFLNSSPLLTAVSGQISTLTSLISESSSSIQVPAAVSSPSVSAPATPTFPVQFTHPEKFSGDSGDCQPFLTQCELHLELQAQNFQTDRAKIAFLILHLTSRAEASAMAEWSRRSDVYESYSCFSQTF